jgi:hypothetical protein
MHHSGPCQKDKTKAAELKDLMIPIQEVLHHHPDFDVREVDTNMQERLMRCLEAGDIQLIDLWEEGDGNQPVQLYKRPSLKHVMPMALFHSSWHRLMLGLERCQSE